MGVADSFHQLERQIMIGRARGTLTEEAEDLLLEESDDLWRRMAPDERDKADRRVRTYIAASAPAELGFQDRRLETGTCEGPLIAA